MILFDIIHSLTAHFASGIGVALMLAKTLIIVIGLQVMRYSHSLTDAKRSQRLRYGGMSLAMLIGPLMEMTAYAFAPQALLAPINGFDLIWNIFLSPYTLGEKHSKSTLLGTAVIFVGSVTATLCGPHQSKELSLHDLESHFLSMRFITYVIVCCTLFICGRSFLQWRKNQLELPPGRTDFARGMLLGIGGGAVGGQSYFLSSAATLVHTNIVDGNWSAWADWLPWVVVGGAAGCGLLNARLMDKGLSEFNVNFFVPMFAGSAIIAGCVSAIVVLRETQNLKTWMMAMYLFGVSLMMFGLGVLTWDASRGSRGHDIAPTEQNEQQTSTDNSRNLEAPLHPESSMSCLHGETPEEKSAAIRTAGCQM